MHKGQLVLRGFLSILPDLNPTPRHASLYQAVFESVCVCLSYDLLLFINQHDKHRLLERNHNVLPLGTVPIEK